MRCARIYIRRSNDEQSGYSPQAQERECRAFCAAEQLQVLHVYMDDGVSGTRRSRPALDQLLADVRPGELIIVHHFDRLSRDTAFLLDLIFKHLDPRDIKIQAVQGGFDPYSAIGKLLLTMQGGVSEYHIDNLRREIRKGLQEKAQQGGWIGGLPQGYCSAWDVDSKGVRVRGSGRAIPDDDAPVVREIFERYASGTESTRSVAMLLNQRGLTARGRYGRVPWTADLVSAVLSNSFYRGLVRYRGQELPGVHPPLVDQETWDRVVSIRERRNRGGGHVHGVRQLGLLSELGRCEHCDEPLHWVKVGTRQTRYYICRNRRKVGVCAAPSMRAEAIDARVLDWLRQLTVPSWMHAKVLAAIEDVLGQQLSGPLVDRRVVEQQIRRLDRLYEVGAKSDDEWQLERQALLRQLEQAPAPAKQAVSSEQALRFLGDLGALLDASDRAGQHALLGRVVQSVWCADNRLIAVRPAPAFGLFIQAMQAVQCTGVTPTGVQPTPVYLWRTWREAA